MPSTVTITTLAHELAQMIIDDRYEYSHACNIAKHDVIFHCGSPVAYEQIALRGGRKHADHWLFLAESGARRYQAIFVATGDDPAFSVIDLLGAALMLAEHYHQHVADIAPILYGKQRQAA